MTPSDFRSLIAASGLSNREAATALELGAGERFIRRLKSGEEAMYPRLAERVIAVAADVLAAQMIRSLGLAAGGKVELASLRVNEKIIHVDSELSAPVARAMRDAILERLARTGLKIERTQ